MAIDVQITPKQRAELQKAFQEFKGKTRDTVVNAMASAGLRMQTGAQEKAPVGTPESTGIPGYQGGTLKQSLLYQPIEGGLGAKVETKVKYAIYQNNGTSRIAGKHFMEAGFEQGLIEIKRKLKLK